MRPALFATMTALAALVVAPSVFASHSFPADVPDSHQFHTEIGIFKDANITVGCTATAFCPADFVRRQAMAAFVDRALGLLVRPGESTQKGVPGSRVAMLDDDLSFVGTEGNALRYRGPDGNVIGGHSGNSVAAGVFGATIAGGGYPPGDNRVVGLHGSVGGGLYNEAGYAATVPGGIGNTASADSSFAAGRRARAAHAGSFVWSGGNRQGGDGYVYSPADYSFSAHATGGVTFWTNVNEPTTGCWIPAGGGSWACTSDRNVKENFRPVDGRRVLQEVAKLPITSWNYKGQQDRFRHLGPTAQDFKAAFGVGEDDKTIGMVDADGVALAAIQALYKENQTLRQDVADLRRAMVLLQEKGDSK